MSEILLQEKASETVVKSVALLYIHPENQELLWKIINKSPLLEQMGQGSLHEKQKWFKSIIQLFYDKTGPETFGRATVSEQTHSTTSTEFPRFPTTVVSGNLQCNSGDVSPNNSTFYQLKQLNQDTIIYMIENMQKQLGRIPSTIVSGNLQNLTKSISAPSFHDQTPSTMLRMSTEFPRFPTTIVSGNLQYSLRPPPKTNINDVADRQKEYESMLAKPLPPEMNFSEKFTDEAISNMDELIAQHKKQREDELKQYAPINTENTVQTSVANVSEK